MVSGPGAAGVEVAVAVAIVVLIVWDHASGDCWVSVGAGELLYRHEHTNYSAALVVHAHCERFCAARCIEDARLAKHASYESRAA